MCYRRLRRYVKEAADFIVAFKGNKESSLINKCYIIEYNDTEEKRKRIIVKRYMFEKLLIFTATRNVKDWISKMCTILRDNSVILASYVVLFYLSLKSDFVANS